MSDLGSVVYESVFCMHDVCGTHVCEEGWDLDEG